MSVVAVVQLFFTCTRCAPSCTRKFLFAEGSLRVVSPSTARPLPSQRARRADAPALGPTPLSVAHAGYRAASSHPVCLGHLGRTVDVVSGVHVRPGQRCSETPPGGTAPGDTPWLQTASALRALKSQRAVLPPVARTGFGYHCGHRTSLTMSTCRTSASHLSFILKVAKEYFSWLSDFKKIPHPLPGVLLLGGWTSGTSRFTKASHTNMRCPPVKSTLRTEKSEIFSDHTLLTHVSFVHQFVPSSGTAGTRQGLPATRQAHTLRETVHSRMTRVSRLYTQTKHVHSGAHPFDTWVTGPVVDYATRLDEREAVGLVEFAIQLNAAARPRGGPRSS